MGLARVFSRSVRFTFRSKKRFLVFLIIFGIVSTFVAFFIDSIDELQTDRFLDQKGVVLEELDEFTVNYTQGQRIRDDILALENQGYSIEDHESYLYADLDDSLRIFSININKPWMTRDLNPGLLETGRFPNNPNEIIVPRGSFQVKNSTNNVTITSDVAIGQTLKFENNNSQSIDLKVVGTFNNDKIQIPLFRDKSLWMVVDITMFQQLIALYGQDMNISYTYSISFTVPGYILDPKTYDAIDSLNNAIKGVMKNEPDGNPYGDWRPQPISLPTESAKVDANNKIVSLGFAILGGIILATLFAYLISRFRRKEIAILKAMGYSNSQVRVSLLAEIMTTSFSGFIVGASTAQGLLFYLNGLSRNGVLRFQSILVSFIITVIITLPGMLLVSRKILKVSPAEAFRSN